VSTDDATVDAARAAIQHLEQHAGQQQLTVVAANASALSGRRINRAERWNRSDG
jgi:hypothetical protein